VIDGVALRRHQQEGARCQEPLPPFHNEKSSIA
jgi:hypothetical protein